MTGRASTEVSCFPAHAGGAGVSRSAARRSAERALAGHRCRPGAIVSGRALEQPGRRTRPGGERRVQERGQWDYGFGDRRSRGGSPPGVAGAARWPHPAGRLGPGPGRYRRVAGACCLAGPLAVCLQVRPASPRFGPDLRMRAVRGCAPRAGTRHVAQRPAGDGRDRPAQDAAHLRNTFSAGTGMAEACQRAIRPGWRPASSCQRSAGTPHAIA